MVQTVIWGGANNHLTGNHNAILGGCGNSDAGFNCVGIFGCNITAVTNTAFHANNYVISAAMPSSCFGAIASQLYFSLFSGPGRPVFIC
jgi:hypothetical protein